MKGKCIKYWCVNSLQSIGISVLIALIFLLFQAGGGLELNGDVRKALLEQISLYPYYLFVTSAFVAMMNGIGYFQVYFSILVSMNSTRKSVTWGILLSTVGMILGVLLISGAVWLLAPSDISDSGIKVLMLCGGILMFMSAVSLVIGLIIAKWGTVGGIIFFCLCVLCGAAAGASVAAMGKGELAQVIMNLLQKFHLWWTFVAGVVVYLAAGIFISINTRKMEVRV